METEARGPGNTITYKITRVSTILLFISALLICGCVRENPLPRAQKGVMDLTRWDFETDGKIHLNGEWEFYWKKLLSPDDFRTAALPEKTGYFDVPGAWNGYGAAGDPIRGFGFATFRLKVKLNPGRERMAVRIDNQTTSYRLWVNGRPISWNGVVGTGRDTAVPQYMVRISDDIDTESRDLEFILQVSNFSLHKGGPKRPVCLGLEPQIRKHQTLLWAVDLTQLGVFGMVGLFHIVFYMLRRKEASFLYFGCICLLQAGRIPFWRSGSKFITVLFPHIPWEVAHKIDQLAWYLIAPLSIMFFSDLYPWNGAGKVLRFVKMTTILFCGIVLFFPARISNITFVPCQIFASTILIANGWILGRAALKNQEGARLMFFCYFLLFPATLMEFFKYYFVMLPGNLIFAALMVFTLAQSFVLSRQYARALGTAEALSEELERKNVALSRLDRLKDEFLANTSHELRTPLNGIVGIAESVIGGIGGKLSDTAKYNLSLIISSGQRLANLVNDILDFSRLKNRDIKLRRKPVNLHALADTVLFALRPLVGEKRIGIINAVPDTLPPVSGDEDRLQQILYNLVGNAIKFTTDGEIRISAAEKNGFMEIAVRDTGIGIPEDRIDAIFQSFEQADASDTREYGGTGLGLSITRRLVELHGGHIEAESKEGAGTTFRFTVPADPHEPEESPVPQAAGAVVTPVLPPPPPEFAPQIPLENRTAEPLLPDSDIRIMVVDDDPVNLRVAANFLSFPGVAITSCANGAAALEWIGSKGRPDLILLDIMMPQMSGYEVCKKLRTRYSPSELPVIMLTARNLVTDLTFGFESGANDYIVKPFTRAELIARVRTHLKLGKAFLVLRENLSLKTELERRKQTVQDLRMLNHRLAGILSRVDEAVLAITESNEVGFCNRSCTRLLGHDTEDIIGLPITAFLHDDVVKRIVSLKSGMEPDGVQTETSRVLHGIPFQTMDKDALLLDIQLACLDLADERLYLLILHRASTPEKGITPAPVPALKVVEALNRNRARLRTLEESLDSLVSRAPLKDPGLLSELKAVDSALAALEDSMAGNQNPGNKRWLALEVMKLSLDYWTEATGTPRSEMALRSKLWHVYINRDGWERTQTLDKYLNPKTFPRRPRWNKILSTADFVLSSCSTASPKRDQLEVVLEKLRILA